MKIAFLVRNPIGDGLGIPILISALEKSGHTAYLIKVDGTESWLKDTKEIKPDAISATLFYGEHEIYYHVIKKIKDSLDIISIVGGPHPTFSPDAVIENSFIDFICIGEGEEAIVEWANKYDHKENIFDVNNIWGRKGEEIVRNPLNNLITDLDRYSPKRGLLAKFPEFNQSKIRYFLSGKGCPFHCSYCFNEQYNSMYRNKGKIVRKRSVDSLISEIESVKSEFGCEYVRFLDDIFTMDKDWLREFIKKYAEKIKVPFSVHIRPNLVDQETVDLLEKGGCNQALIGIEAGNDYVRNNIFKRGLSQEQIIKACTLLNEKRIYVMSQNILCIPDNDHFKNDIETLELNIKCNPLFAWASVLHPYPNTPIYHDIIERRIPIKTDYDSITYHKDTPFILEKGYQSINLHHIFDIAVKLPKLKRPIIAICSINSKAVTFFLYAAGELWKSYMLDKVVFSAKKRANIVEFISYSTMFILKRLKSRILGKLNWAN